MGVRSIGIPPTQAGGVAWSAITGKPSTFPPSAHVHVIGDVTGLQAALDSKLTSVSWSAVTGKPTTFTPSAHSHPISDVTGLQSALDGKQPAGSYAPLVHTHAIADVTGLQASLDSKLSTVSWSQVTGKPSTFPPSAHNHIIADVTGLQAALDSKTSLSLGSAIPQPLGTATAGSSTNASREDHVHAPPAHRLSLLTTATIGETTLISLSLGVRRYTVNVAGVVTTDRIIAVLNGVPSNGSLQDVYASAAGVVNIGVLAPALGIGATIAVPVALYRVVP